MVKKPQAKGESHYDASSIKHLAGPEKVRKKPSMYLGELGPACAWTVLREPCDNVVDEALNGHASLCLIVADKDGSYWVGDNGRGIPAGTTTVTDEFNPGKKIKMSALHVATGVLHGGGKLDADDTGAYAVSRGCFVGETTVRLLSGKVTSMEKLYARWQKNQTPIPILAYNVKKRKLEPGEITYAQITKKTRDLVEVVYDNGNSAKVTPDHPFYVRRGASIKKIEAAALKPGDSLVSIYYREDQDGYPELGWSTDLADTVWLHTVACVKPIHLNNAVPVYDITVDDAHTFFIEAGPGKFRSGQYAESGVLVSNSHGIGQKGTNFTSHYFEVWSCYEGTWSYIKYKDGVLDTPVQKCKAPPVPHDATKRMSRGTLVHFKPDAKIIGADKFPFSMLTDWARIAAYFTPGLGVMFVNMTGKKVETQQWHYPDGPTQYVNDRLVEIKAEAVEPTRFQYSDGLCSVVVAFTNYDGCDFKPFTNGLFQADGGLHFRSVFAAMNDALQPFMGKGHTYTINELKDGVTGLINVNLSAPRFSSQTKEKLVDERAGKPVKEALEKAFTEFFTKNKAMTKRLLDRCTEIRKLRAKFSLDKQATAKIKKAISGGFPVKAMLAPKAKPEQRELFLLEGESASGGARFARDSAYQEVLPLRGKLKNAIRAEVPQIISSETVLGILTMLGYNPAAKNAYDEMRVKGKVVLLADPDPDGPLHADTLIRVKLVDPGRSVKSEPAVTRAIQDIYTHMRESATTEVYVEALDQQTNKLSWVKVPDIQTRYVAPKEQIVNILFSNGTRYLCTMTHRWAAFKKEVVQSRNVNWKGVAFEGDDMQFIPAQALKCGDRVLSYNYAIDEVESVSVSKVQVEKRGNRDGMFYCLSVPTLHNFVLPDGVVSGNCHINSLILSLLWKLVPVVFEKNMVYVAEAPEFYAVHKGNAYFGASPTELREKMKKDNVPANAEVHHVKGYGELPADLLEKVAFNPSTRWVSQILVKHSNSGAEFVKIMANDVEARKELMGTGAVNDSEPVVKRARKTKETEAA